MRRPKGTLGHAVLIRQVGHLLLGLTGTLRTQKHRRVERGREGERERGRQRERLCSDKERRLGTERRRRDQRASVGSWGNV